MSAGLILEVGFNVLANKIQILDANLVFYFFTKRCSQILLDATN